MEAGPLRELLEAASLGKTQAVATVLSGVERVESVLLAGTSAGTTLLHVAAASGSLSTLALVLKEAGRVAAAKDASGGGGDRFLAQVHGAATVTGLTPMHEAVLRSHTLLVHSLLASPGAVADAADVRGWSPLMYAAFLGDVGTVSALLEADAQVARVDGDGLGPLHLAAMRNKVPVARLFVQRGADVNAKTTEAEQNTPLLLATAHGASNMVAYLLSVGGDPSVPNTGGFTPSAVARTKMVKKLLRADHSARIVESRAALAAALGSLCNGDTSLAEFRRQAAEFDNALSALSNNLGDADDLVASLAFDYNHPVEVPCVLRPDGARAGAPVPPLFAACVTGNVQVVRFLMDKGGSLLLTAPWGEPPLCAAARSGNKRVVDLVLLASTSEHIEQLDSDGKTSLWYALMLDNQTAISVMEALTEGGVPVSVVSGTSSETVLFEAVRNDCLECVIHLLGVGADPGVASASLVTPLHLAAERNLHNIAETLMRAGASPNSLDADHNSPLHTAALHGALETAHLLVKFGARVSEQTRALYTPLHAAAAVGDIEMAQLLLDAGADMRKMNASGDSPIDVALNRGHSEFVMTFREAAAPAPAPAPVPAPAASAPATPAPLSEFDANLSMSSTDDDDDDDASSSGCGGSPGQRKGPGPGPGPGPGLGPRVEMFTVAETGSYTMREFTPSEGVRWIRHVIHGWAPDYAFYVDAATAKMARPGLITLTVLFSKPTQWKPVPAETVAVHFTLHEPTAAATAAATAGAGAAAGPHTTYRIGKQDLVLTVGAVPFNQAWLDRERSAKARIRAIYAPT